MKIIKKTSAFILAVMILSSMLSIPTNAAEADNTKEEITTSSNIQEVIDKATKPTVKAESSNSPLENENSNNTSVDKEDKKSSNENKPSHNKKAKLSTSAKAKSKTGATVAGGTIGNTYTTTDLKDIAYYGGAAASGSVKYEYFEGGNSNNKYRYPNGTNWYSGKVARITITIGQTKAVWTVEQNSLKGDGGVDQGTGTMVVSRTGNDHDIPKFHYNRNSTNSIKSPWNGQCKNSSNTDYKGIIDHDKVTTIEIDKSVRNISEYLFWGFKGKFKTLLLHNYEEGSNETRETIKHKAFASTSVETIIWNSTKIIEGGAFSDCDSLKTVDFTKNTNSNTNYNHTLKSPAANSSTNDSVTGKNYKEQFSLEEGCFQGCDKLKTVNMGGVTTIPKKCFYGCDLLNDITWANVETVQAYAFSSSGGGADNKGLTLTIRGGKYKGDSSAKAIDEFTNKTVTDDAPLRINSFRNCKYKTIEFTSGNLTRSGVEAFWYSDNLTTINVTSSNLTTISARSFYSCEKLKSVNFKGGALKTIGEDAFRGCDALEDGKTTSDSGNAALFGYSNAQIINNKANNNYNVLELPSTIKEIRQGAFRKCISLKAVTWNNIASVQLEKIQHNTFLNDYSLMFFALPDSVVKIEGALIGNDYKANDNEKKFGAFHITEDNCTNIINENFTFAVSQENSKLEVIGDKAFFHPVELTGNKGLVFWDRTNQRAVGNTENTNTRVLVLPHLKYIGNRAFMNNPNLTGSLLTDEYINIGSRSFVNTKLTNFYFRWNPEAENSNSTTTKVDSSVIGSSSSFVNNQSRAYNNTINKQASDVYDIFQGTNSSGIRRSTYYDLNTILNNNTKGLFALWGAIYKDLIPVNDTFVTWTATKAIGEQIAPNQPTNVPERTYGEYNNRKENDGVTEWTQTDSAIHSDIKKTKTYIKTEAEWVEERKIAKEKVTFAYKNKHNIDYVFVVDNSPSMDTASKTTKYNTSKDANTNIDTIEQNSPHNGTNNASKMMNAYSQIYKISQKLLNNNNENSVSIISFRGNDKNELQNSSKFLTVNSYNENSSSSWSSVPMHNADDVKNALFNTSNGYEDNNDGVTNYSSGLSRAYYLLNALKITGNKKVVIMITDGRPTYYKNEQGKIAHPANANGVPDEQVNGIDWANAITNNTDGSNYNSTQEHPYTVHSFVTSKYTGSSSDIQTSAVDGLGVDIYGIMLGNDNSTVLSNIVTPDKAEERLFISANMKDTAEKLNATLKSINVENYKLIVPFDDNFTLSENSISNMKVTIKYQSGNSTEEVTNDITQEGTIALKAGGTSATCKITFLPSQNALQFSFNDITYKTINSLYSSISPYITYTFDNILLDYDGSGTIVKKSNKKYAAVSDNSVATSRNSSQSIIVSNGLNGNIPNGNPSQKTASGAYVLLNNNIFANYAEPIYLPLNLTSISINKYKTTVSGNIETTTTDRLAGAKFKVYSKTNGKYYLQYFTKSSDNKTYTLSNSSTSGNTYSVESLSNSTITLTELPQGEYYIYEYAYPPSNDSSFSYKQSSKNGEYTSIVPYGETTSLDTIKVDTSSSTTVSKAIYNKPEDTQYGYFIGTKNGITFNDDGTTTIKPLTGAKMGIFDTYAKAETGLTSNALATTFSDSEGKYYFSLKNITQHTTYYFAEITPPDGYQKVKIVKAKAAHSTTGNWIVPEINDVALATIRVWVDSSDNIQDNFIVGLQASNTATNSGPITYTKKTSTTDREYFLNNDNIPKNGYCEFKVPIFYAHSTYSSFENDVNNSQVYEPITYTVREKGFGNNLNAIPQQYMYQEYAQLSSIEYPFEYWGTQTTEQIINMSDEWSGTDTSQWSLYYGQVDPRVCIYNMSLKLQITCWGENYDLINSSFKTVNYNGYSDVKVPTVTTEISPYSGPNTGKITEWTVGNLMTSNGSEYQNGSNQWRTDYFDIEDAEILRLNIDGFNYRYYVFFYDAEKNFLSYKSTNDDGQTIKETSNIYIPNSTQYFRICRYAIDSSLIEDNDFEIDVDKCQGSSVTLDSFFGTTDFKVEQTSIQDGYYLMPDLTPSSYVSDAASYRGNITIDKETGKRYMLSMIRFDNRKTDEFVKVGSNGYIQYILIGVVICSSVIIFYVFYKKRKKNFFIGKNT